MYKCPEARVCWRNSERFKEVSLAEAMISEKVVDIDDFRL